MNEYYVEQENQIISQTGMEFFRFEFSSPQKNVRPHIHSAAEILLIVKGRFRVYSNDREHLAQEGEAILFRPNTIHRIYQEEENGIYYVLKLHPSFISALASEAHAATYLLHISLHDETSPIAWSRTECDTLGITALRDKLIAETEQDRYCSELAIKIFSAEILLILLREIQRHREQTLPSTEPNEQLTRRIYETIIYINKHYAEEITVAECSRRAFMSYSYFSRKFKEITGKSFKQYLNITRINHAEKALLSTKKPITQIAMECGFSNPAYFSAIYKQTKGISPSEIRCTEVANAIPTLD